MKDSKLNKVSEILREILAKGFIGTRADLIAQLAVEGVVVSQPMLSKLLRLNGVSITLQQNRNLDQWYLTK